MNGRQGLHIQDSRIFYNFGGQWRFNLLRGSVSFYAPSLLPLSYATSEHGTGSGIFQVHLSAASPHYGWREPFFPEEPTRTFRG